MYRSIIPNLLTALNLVFGMCSILSTFSGELSTAAVLILVALVSDGLDGRAARFFHASSEMGKEMDSLCDLVSFGAAPAALAYALCLKDYGGIGWGAAIFFAACGMWRLARFNVNTDVVHGYFMGLAIPAGGCLVATSTLLFRGIGLDPHALGLAYPLLVAIVGYLMASKVHYPDFKGSGEKIYFVAKLFAVCSFAAILFIGRAAPVEAALFAVFATYAMFGLLNYGLALLAKGSA